MRSSPLTTLTKIPSLHFTVALAAVMAACSNGTRSASVGEAAGAFAGGSSVASSGGAVNAGGAPAAISGAAGMDAAAGMNGGVTAGGGAGQPAGSLLVDDAEDDDLVSQLGSTWYSYDDSGDGGLSTQSLAVGPEGYGGSLHAIALQATFGKGTLPYEPYVGFGVSTSGFSDLTAYGTLRYAYRGAAHEVRIETANITDWDPYAFQLPQSSTWKAVELDVSQFLQGGWGEPMPFDLTQVTNISWSVRGADGEAAVLELDDIALGVGGPPAPTVPNLTLHPPSPPKLVEVGSLEIPNPLQVLAARALDKGYNLTNWLEQDRFSEFGVYDQTFVQKLAVAGFKGLRLPIDLDLYIEPSPEPDVSTALVVSEDLWTVLDSFDAWTAAAGLSLTIDYHQYDASFSMDDPKSQTDFVQLWSAVAEHFAESPRDDLFFELMNEPELFSGAKPPTAAEWTTLAEQTIGAIRAHAPTRPILFGDVQWYDIDKLVQRTPFADQNVIYVVHSYEPFIFTHQGAAWAGMGTTHDIPFPYSQERWSEYMEDFGFSDLNESWQVSALQGYYQTGNKETLYNHLAKAKAWGVTNNVPVICNEFGAYDRAAQKEDVVRYYTALREVFSELEIPWQIWFMIMDATTGEIDPAYRTAFALE